LIEKGSDSTGIFKQAREAEELAEIARIAHQAAVRRPISRSEERGLIAAFAEQVMPEAKQGRPYLWLDQAALMMGVLLMLQTGRTLSPRSRVERDPDGTAVLVFDQSFGILGDHDSRGVFSNYQKSLEHLAANGWVVLSGSGASREIRLGTRALRALGDLPPKKSRAAA
jgi:hypothetical protein